MKLATTTDRGAVMGMVDAGSQASELGIPLGAFVLIWSFRKPIADGNATAHSSLGFLFAGYSTTRGGFIAAWESMIMLRKLVITLLSIIDFSPAVQVRRRCSSATLPGVLLVTRSLLPSNPLPSPSHSSLCSRCSCWRYSSYSR